MSFLTFALVPLPCSMVGQEEGEGAAAWCLAAGQAGPTTPLTTKSFQVSVDLSLPVS